MKLAYSTNAYTRTSLIDALNSIAGIGFDGAEILCDHPHLFPGVTTEHDVETIKALLEEKPLGISNLNANTANCYFNPLPAENIFEPSLSSANKEHRAWRIHFSQEAIRLASYLGARCISVTSGHPGSGGSPQQGLTYFIESLQQICKVAERYDIQVGIEYEPGLLVERAAEVAEVIEQVGSPHLGVNLDIGHSYLNHETAAEAIDCLAGRIWNVHVEDIASHKHYHLVPGDGDLPIADYLNRLKNAGYDGYLTVELYTFPDKPEVVGRRALQYLQKL